MRRQRPCRLDPKPRGDSGHENAFAAQIKPSKTSSVVEVAPNPFASSSTSVYYYASPRRNLLSCPTRPSLTADGLNRRNAARLKCGASGNLSPVPAAGIHFYGKTVFRPTQSFWRIVHVYAVAVGRPHRGIKPSVVAPVIELVEVPLSIPIAKIGPPFDGRRVWRGIQGNESKESV